MSRLLYPDEFFAKFILFHKDLLATKNANRNCHLGRRTGLCLPLQAQNKSYPPRSTNAYDCKSRLHCV